MTCYTSPVRESASRPSFGDLLRRYRTSAGFSQEELAGRANVSLAAVSALERGTRRAPQRQTLTLLLRDLDLEAPERDELLEAASRSRARTRSTVLGDGEPLSGSTNQKSLPLYLTSFVAQAEIADLARLLRDSRLVTIVGAGGIGKALLACEAASRLGASFESIIFADLAPLIDDDMVVPYLVRILKVEGREGSVIEAVASALGNGRFLRILDNCERILSATAKTKGVAIAAYSVRARVRSRVGYRSALSAA
jgi:transcriptional regulator with XRE-family HTH domain